MKKVLMILTILLCAASVMAEDVEKRASPSMTSWLASLQYRLAQITPKKSISVTTGVAGVRGAKEDSAATLYWKGKKDAEPVTEEEMMKFKACIDLAEKGDRGGALEQLDDFMKLYPDSALIPDAKKTYDLVKAEPKVEAPKAQPADEEKKSEIRTEQKQEDKKEAQKKTQ
jgi:TolA-binding protein